MLFHVHDIAKNLPRRKKLPQIATQIKTPLNEFLVVHFVSFEV